MLGQTNLSNNNNNKKDDKSQKDLSWFTLVKEIKENAKRVGKVAEKELNRAVAELERAKLLLGSINRNIHEMSDIPDDQTIDADLKDCLDYLKASVEQVQTFVSMLLNPNVSKKQMLVSLNSLLASLPPLLISIKTLNLGELTSEWPQSVEDLQKDISDKLSEFIEGQIPIILQGYLDKVKSDMFAVDATSLQSFSEKSQLEQTLILVALEKVNKALCDFVVFIDKNEIKYSFKEGSILEKIKFKLSFGKTQTEQTEKTLKQWCEQFSEAYAARREKSQYRNKIEIFPYDESKNRARREYLKKCIQKYTPLKNNEDKIRESAKNEVIDLIDKKIEEFDKDKGIMSVRSYRENRIAALTHLKVAFKQNITLDEALITAPASVDNKAPDFKAGLQDSEVKNVRDEIKKIFDAACDARRIHQLKKAKMEICRLLGKIGRPCTLVNVDSTIQQLGSEEAAQQKALEEKRQLENQEAMPQSDLVTQDDAELNAAFLDMAQTLLKTLKNFMPATPVSPAAVVVTDQTTTAAAAVPDPTTTAAGGVQDPTTIAAVGANTTTVIAGSDEKDWLSEIIKQIETTEKYFKIIIDNETFKKYFLDAPVVKSDTDTVTDTSIPAPWIKDLGQIFKSAKQLAEQAKNLRAAITKHNASETTPQKYLTGIVKMGSQLIETGGSLMLAAKELSDYCIERMQKGDEFPAIRNLVESSYNTLQDFIRATSVENHPQLDIKKGIQKIEDELKETIDDEIFAQYFQDNAVTSKTTVRAPTSWIQDLGQIFKSAKQLAKQTENLRAAITKPHATPQINLTDLVNMTTNVTKITGELGLSVISLSNNPFIKQNNLIKTLREETKNITKEIKDHPLVEFVNSNGKRLAEELLGNKALTHAAREAAVLYPTLADKCGQDKETQKQVSEALDQIKILAADADEKFTDLDAPITDVVSYIMSHLKPIIKVMLAFQQLNKSFKDLPGNLVLERIQELNILFRRFYLFADQLEIQLYLKEGYITNNIHIGKRSLFEVVSEFHALLNEKGYEFKPDECFPYKKAVQYQRIELLEKQEKITPMKNDVANINEGKKLLSRRIGADIVVPPRVDARKNDVNFQEVINRVDIKLEQLRKRREVSLFFFSQSRRTDLENRIMGLSELRKRYEKLGYTVNEALKEIGARHSDCYNAIKKHDSAFKSEIKKIDEQIPKAARGNMCIDYRNPQLAPPNFKDKELSVIKRRLQLRIDKLQAEASQSIFNITHTKDTKICLLMDIKNNLKTLSLDDSIKKIRDANPKTFYLLFEGRTGEVMKDIYLGTLSKEKMIQRINVEIARLTLEQGKSYWFFATTRRDAIQERIDALKILRDNDLDITFSSSSSSSSDELSQKQWRLLQVHEKDLLQDIRRWKDISRELSDAKKGVKCH